MENQTKIIHYDTDNNLDKIKTNNNYFSISSESIVSFIIEKLISYTITESQKRQIYNNIPQKCFSYLTDIFKNYLKLEFLTHEFDDYSNENNIEMNRKKSLMNTFNDLNDTNSSNLSLKKYENKNFHTIPSIKSEKSDGDESFKRIYMENNSNMNNSVKSSNLIDNPFHNIENKYFDEKPKILFFDNYSSGINDWSICDEPVNII